MRQLHHNGVLVPPKYKGKGLTIKVKGEKIKLSPEQEEMAIAWAKKVETPYIEDHIFTKNFYSDFSKKLGKIFKPDDIDYSEVLSYLEEEREWKVNLSKEDKKQLTAQRKVLREKNREYYGNVWIDGVKMEVANYTVEPSSIFMGRGDHPLRGRWKEGPSEGDIELNLSPDAIIPPGNWKSIIWQPNSMWIARWKDKLTGKMKYVWLSDSSILKQKKDIEKYAMAKRLRKNLLRVKKHIRKNLNVNNLRRRKIATICYLIDNLKIRVGDEKDPDEADTVGASTLRSEHVRFNGDGTVTFNFLGKDSVPHVFRVKLPDKVNKNLKEFASISKLTLFGGINSKHVSGFLDEVMVGLSAKVFRTYYASKAAEDKLEKTPVKIEDPDYLKKHIATMANLKAAKVCNHRRTIPKTWRSTLEKKKARLKALKNRAREARKKIRKKIKDKKNRYKERLEKKQEKLKALEEKLEAYRKQLDDRKSQGKSIRTINNRIKLKERGIRHQKQIIRNLKTKHLEQIKKLSQKLKSREQRDKTAIDKLKLGIKTRKETRDYNLTTTLKSYIDPQIYFEWGKKVDFDWKQYYPKTLQRKFSWVDIDSSEKYSTQI